MVLESFINYLHAEKRPEEMILFGFIIGTVSILLALWVFPSYASFAMVTFAVMAVLPLMVNIMKAEKEKQEKFDFWKIMNYRPAVSFFIFLFIGLTIAFALWYLLLPVETANNLFFLQANTITEINTPTGAAILGHNSFTDILLNNLRVLALCVLFSFVFGSGAIFILAWNASVLGVAMASSFKVAVAVNGAGTVSYFTAAAFAVIRYLIHGIPEVTAYFLGGLAGAIVAFTFLDYKSGYKKLKSKIPHTVKGALVLVSLAVGLLIVSGLIESFLTPLFIQ